ncbi:hypothetical protein BVY04_03540 [bacterium M21]|nr:hypothetical protein BVY04_03540 [bacterium M21]
MRKLHYILITYSFFFAATALCSAGCKDLELALKNQKKVLLSIAYKIKPPAISRTIRFTLDTLQDHELYLRKKDQSSYLFIASNGEVTGELQTTLKTRGELYITPAGDALFIDELAFSLNLSNWEIFWVATKPGRPRTTSTLQQRQELTDGFMRTDLVTDSHWQITSGKWSLRQRGGGMVADDQHARNFDVQRSVNPFSVIGSGGMLTYTDGNWRNALVEARFYFGKPVTGRCPDSNTLPEADMMLMIGAPSGYHIAWGWDAQSNCFSLRSRTGTGAWLTHWQWRKNRPPLTNWVRLGLSLRAGVTAEVFLDGESMHRQVLTQRTDGSFSLLAGNSQMEVDDVRAETLPETKKGGHPIFIQSRQFAKKSTKGRSDPDGFTQWARSTDTFIKRKEKIDDRWFRAIILTRMPLMGDFLYESRPYHKDAGEIQPGLYEFQILRQDESDPTNLETLHLVKSLKFMRLEDGWISNEFEAMDEEEPQFTLRFRRRQEDGNRITVQIGSSFVPITEPVEGPVHFAIVRRLPAGNHARFPKPWHHVLICRNLTNEFFEQAPTDWNWIEGGYGMDSRWACQDQWNFMTCAGTGVPMMISKRVFSGHQQHEFFSSLRAVMPWDIGDETFAYNRDSDKSNGFRRLKENGGWYNRHDVNFSFCSDGKNPLSGYAVLFAGYDNRETLLMRKGKVVATSRRKLPEGASFGSVHWIWLHFNVKKYGSRVVVELGSEILFDYTDSDPIKGGHVAFWTVRNGTVLARAISVGEDVKYKHDALYVANSTPSNWTPLIRDSVQLIALDKPFTTRVKNSAGAGFFAVRKMFNKPVDLRKTPVLSLPIKIPDSTHAQVHVMVNKRSFFIPLNQTPVTRMKSLLTSQFERGEQFQREPWDLQTLKNKYMLPRQTVTNHLRLNLLRALADMGISRKEALLSEISVGNTSNADYLLAGNNANQAGAYYDLGEPEFLPAATPAPW